jgi:glycosyltransferase involved in cell wall biosynthesis
MKKNESKLRFSVFTATYNRASFLPKVYKSLIEQSFQNFEWIIIDDGSTDETEELINSFISEGRLKQIRYVKKENGGKHTAWRVATRMFQGDYTLTIDSDDYLTSKALEIFDRNWSELEKSDQYELFWEVKARNMYEDGTIVGNPLPEKVFDTNSYLLTYKYKIKGDLHGCRKTRVLQNEAKIPDNFIFEERCSNFAESIRWFRAGNKFKTRYIEEVTAIVALLAPNRLSANKIKSENHSYSTLISCIFSLNESRDVMLKWSKIDYVKTIAVFLYMAFRLKKNPFNVSPYRLRKLDVLIMFFGYLPVYLIYLIRG